MCRAACSAPSFALVKFGMGETTDLTCCLLLRTSSSVLHWHQLGQTHSIVRRRCLAIHFTRQRQCLPQTLVSSESKAYQVGRDSAFFLNLTFAF